MDESERNPWDPADDAPATDPAATPDGADDAADPDTAPTAAGAGPGAEGDPVEGAGPDSAGAFAGFTPDDAAPAADPMAEDDPNRNKIVIGAIAAFVLIALIGFVLTRSGGDDEPSDNAGPTSQTSAPQSVTISGTSDTFDRADSKDSLGNLPNGTTWQVDAGTWGIKGNQAYVAGPAPKRRDFAVVGIGNPEGQAQVRLTKMGGEAGLAFRYKGPYNYWAVIAVPKVATWNVIKVIDGKQEVVGNTGKSAISDGTTVGVRLVGDKIAVVVNGAVVKTLTDKALAGVGKVGMTAKGDEAGTVRFDDFIAGGAKGQPIVAPKKSGDKAGSTTSPPTTTK